MNPIHLLVLEGAVLVVGGIVGVLTDSWQAVVATQTIVIACAARLHYRRGKRG